MLQRPTVLRMNRKDAQAGRCTLTLWGARQSSETTMLGCNGGGVSKPDVGAKHHVVGAASSTAVEHDIVIPNCAKSMKGVPGQVDEHGSGSVPVYIAVFVEEHGYLWGSAAVKMHDVMNECLQNGQTLVAIPVTDSTQTKYLLENVLSIAEATLCNA